MQGRRLFQLLAPPRLGPPQTGDNAHPGLSDPCACGHLHSPPTRTAWTLCHHHHRVPPSPPPLGRAEQMISKLASTAGLRPDANTIQWLPVRQLVEKMWAQDPQARPTCPAILVVLSSVAAEVGAEKASSDINCKCHVM